MSDYQMPVKAIKSILLKEHESFIQSARNNMHLFDYGDYMLRIADETIREKIAYCDSYPKLEDFIGESRRMSLQEWIDSL